MRVKVVLLTAMLVLAQGAWATESIPAQAKVYFSPNGGAQEAICNSILGAKKSVYLQGFLFSSRPIANALIAAHEAGKDVKVLLDKSLDVNPRTKQVSRLLKAGVPVCFDHSHGTAHNKIVVIDQDRVLTGSFNFIKKAEEKNSENLLVLDSEALNKKYRENWDAHWAHRVCP